MDYFTFKRTLIMTVIFLVILNLGTLTTIWFLWKPGVDRPGIVLPEVPPPPPPPPVNIRAILPEEIGLSEKQRIRFNEASGRFLRRSEDVLLRYHAEKRRLFEELGRKNPDSLLIGHLTMVLGQRQTDLERIMVDYFLELRKLCTPEQIERFPGIIDLMLEKLSLKNPQI